MLVWLLTISSNQIGQAGRSAQLMNRNELHVAVPFFFFVHLEIDPHHVKSTGTEIRKRGSARHFIVWFIGSDLSPKSKITKNTKTGQRWTVLSIMWRIKMHLIIPCMYFIYRPRFTHFVWYSSRPLIVTNIRLYLVISKFCYTQWMSNQSYVLPPPPQQYRSRVSRAEFSRVPL
jgi:hypothetical protein